MPGVDDWFRPSPERVETGSGSGEVKRVAILRNPDCTALVGFGCSQAVLDELTQCQAGADSDARYRECVEQAAGACGLSRRGEPR